MLGKNHAIAAAAAWIWVNHAVPQLPGVESALTGKEILISAAVVAGAGVIPDLDHPGSTPSNAFGWVSKLVSKIVAKGGHRQVTHSLAFALLVSAILWVSQNLELWWPDQRATEIGLVIAAVFVFCCAAVGVVLLGPSLNIKVPTLISWGLGVAAAWWVLIAEPQVALALPHMAAVGIVCHIVTDGITRAGVPLLMPLTNYKFSARLIRTGGTGERVIALGILAVGVWGGTLLF